MSFASDLRTIVVAAGLNGRLKAAYCVPPELAFAGAKSKPAHTQRFDSQGRS
jgi:hypothetical protein